MQAWMRTFSSDRYKPLGSQVAMAGQKKMATSSIRLIST
jgi:hypothetical protein